MRSPQPRGLLVALPVLVLSGLILSSTPAQGTQLRFTDQACPFEADDVVRVYEKVSANTHGGYDSDGASYSTKGQFREYAVATCARSLFSLYGGDMSLQLTAADIARLEPVLSQARAQLDNVGEPTVWERYAIAAAMYEALGRGPLFLADLWLEASWVARDQAVGVYLGLRGPAAARELLRLGQVELARPDLTAAQRKTLTYNMARVAHRGGFNAERDDWLTRFDALAPHTEAEATALERFRHIATQVEPELQDQAITQLRLGLADRTLPAASRSRSTYLLADLLRRRGQPDEALGLYNVVLSDERADKELRELALVLAAELAG